jgi:3-dehydroquinate synthase
LIAHSVEIKKQVVEQDPTEKGLRKILNFGHTLGHAVETYFLDKDKPHQLFHGEAIAVGMVMESYLSLKKGLITESILLEIEEFIFATYGRIVIQDEDVDPILALTRQDKKNRGSQVRFSLIDGVGSCTFDQVISSAEMKKAIAYYRG